MEYATTQEEWENLSTKDLILNVENINKNCGSNIKIDNKTNNEIYEEVLYIARKDIVERFGIGSIFKPKTKLPHSDELNALTERIASIKSPK